jgi:hypothetical protein
MVKKAAPARKGMQDFNYYSNISRTKQTPSLAVHHVSEESEEDEEVSSCEDTEGEEVSDVSDEEGEGSEAEEVSVLPPVPKAGRRKAAKPGGNGNPSPGAKGKLAARRQVKKRTASTVEEEEEEVDDAGEGTSGKATAPAKKRKTAAGRAGKKEGKMKPPKICTVNSAVRDFSQPGLKLGKEKFLLGMLGEYC